MAKVSSITAKMAILASGPRIKVEIVVKDELAMEYDSTARDESPLANKTTMKYIKAANDAESYFKAIISEAYR